MFNKLNLQFFADEEDFVLEDEFPMTDDEEVDYEEEETEDIEVEDLEEEGDSEEPEPLDKKTKAIIRYKKEVQELKKELEERDAAKEADELEKESIKRVAELQMSGYSEETAREMADKELEMKKLKTRVASMELASLEGSYPGISSYASQLVKDQENAPGFTLEQIYLAKYYKQNEYDRKTQIEQALMHKAKQNRASSLEPASPNKKASVKLSAEDERVYQYLKKTTNKSLTRERFLELSRED